MNEKHEPKVTVWSDLFSHGLIEPMFFENTVNSQRYLDMLRNDFLSKFLASELPIDTQRFVQNGATLHADNVVLDFLNSLFGNSVISNR